MGVDDSIQLIHMSMKESLIRTPEEIGGAEKLHQDLQIPYLTLRDSHTLLSPNCLGKLRQNEHKVPGPITLLIWRNTKMWMITQRALNRTTERSVTIMRYIYINDTCT